MSDSICEECFVPEDTHPGDNKPIFVPANNITQISDQHTQTNFAKVDLDPLVTPLE
jgi:hypothetical protein